MAVTAQEVQKLREMTGAGILDCQKALLSTSGSVDKAIQFLREKGKASAQTKAGRSAGQGAIVSWISEDGKAGSLIELNCETDFVARTKDFQDLALQIATAAAKNKVQSVEDLLKQKQSSSSETLESLIKEKIGKLGENMVLKRVKSFGSESSQVGNYIHSPFENALYCGRLGVLLEVNTELKGAPLSEILKEVSMQIAATAPRWIKKEDIPSEMVEKEKAIYLEQCKQMGKPEVAWPKIMDGKFKDFYKQFCLLEQNHVRDTSGKTSVQSYIESASKPLGAPLSIVSMVRFKVGEDS